MMCRLLFTLAIFAAALVARATPQLHDANDLWVDPNELGWGLNVFHQGDTLFASLFVYGPDGKPRWYTGSSLVGDDGGPLHDRPSTYSGPLYESTGPWFGQTSFDPAKVTRRQVGKMSMEIGNDAGGNYLLLFYDVDGVKVEFRKLRRFTFGNMGLTGTYTGYQANPQKADDVNANITLNGSSFNMTTQGSLSGSCNYSGTRRQDGSLSNISGNFACNDGRSGPFFMAAVDVTRHGFTSSFSGNLVTANFTSMVAQRTSSNIRGDGHNTNLWLIRNESGWGFNIIEQGDTLFGTLFVYDAEGKPHWYSASNLTYELCAPPDAASDCIGRYRGALVESTGPYFGTSFNAAAVQRRQVGTVTFDVYGLSETANLTYSIDGVTVTNKQSLRPFAFQNNSLAGSYVGHMTALNGNSDRGVQLGAMTIDITDSSLSVGNSVVVTMRGSGRTCSMQGNRTQLGRQVWASGPYTCGGGSLGTLLLEDVYVTWDGFTGSFSLDGHPVGRIDATRTTAR